MLIGVCKISWKHLTQTEETRKGFLVEMTPELRYKGRVEVHQVEKEEESWMFRSQLKSWFSSVIVEIRCRFI